MPYQEKLKLRTTDCDKEMRITPAGVLDLFQEAAGGHCIPHKIDVPTLIKENGLTWVLIGMSLEFKRLPVWPELLTINTWAKSLKGFKALRDYAIEDNDGNNIINGSSVWALVDIKSKRPSKIDSLNHDMEIEPDSHSIPGTTPGRMESIKLDDFEGSPFVVNHSDLDMNHHVSNIQYLKWFYSYLDQDFIQKNRLVGMNISYKGETCFGDKLIFKGTIDNGKCYHSFLNDAGKEICSIESKWLSL